MDIRTPEQQYNPYRIFTREQWARLRDDTPMTLEPGEFARLRSMHDRLDMQEVEDIYLPLSRLLSIYVDATQRLYQAQRQFLDIRDRKVPYIIGIAGSVAGGKSTTARVLQALLARWSPQPKVDLVTTDGFLFPNAVLEREGLMQKKGFPESYDLPTLLSFLSDIKAGRRPVRAPIYSHLAYDIVPNQWIEIDRPDILIVEGVNVLQTGRLPRDGKAVPVRVRLLRLLGLYRCRGAGAAANGMCAASSRSATPRSTIPNHTSIATRSCRTRRRRRQRSRSGSAPTSPISRTTFCRPARARR